MVDVEENEKTEVVEMLVENDTNNDKASTEKVLDGIANSVVVKMLEENENKVNIVKKVPYYSNNGLKIHFEKRPVVKTD